MTSELKSNKLWVFGYGSLCWQPGFEYSNQLLGFIRGYSRKFWQGNTAHRGTPEKPGRVATLVEEEQAITWGIAYELVGDVALKYLEERECTLGGYQTTFTLFFPRNGVASPFPALLYVATPANCHWLGPAPLPDLATQIADCHGSAGHNVEYVIRLADFVRDHFPEVNDEHLFSLESLVRQRVKERNVAIQSLIKENGPPSLPTQGEGHLERRSTEIRRDSFQFQSRVVPKKLLCLKV